MRRRAARGEQIFHPLDATVSLDGVRPRFRLPTENGPKAKGKRGRRGQRKPGAGVTLQAGRYEVNVGRRIDGRHCTFYGGRFDTREEAERAANELARRLDGGQPS